MKRLFLLYILIGALAIPFVAEAQQLKATAKIDTANLLIGQQRKLTIGLDFPRGSKVVWPFIPDTLPNGIEIVTKGKIDTVPGGNQSRINLQQSLVITSFDTGILMVPPFSFYNDELRDSLHLIAQSDPFMITVNTVAVDTTKAIRDIKGPLHAPVTFKELLPWIFGGLAAVALIWFLIWLFFYRKRNKPIISLQRRPEIPAFQVALEEFERLRQAKLWQAGRVKEYHSLLTEILRNYLETSYGFLALEMTSDEIISKLSQQEISIDNLNDVRELLNTADLVKFAKANPLPDVHDQSLRQAIQFVNDTHLKGLSFIQNNNNSENSKTL